MYGKKKKLNISSEIRSGLCTCTSAGRALSDIKQLRVLVDLVLILHILCSVVPNDKSLKNGLFVNFPNREKLENNFV